MLGLYVSVPIACFRKGLAREYLETELIPPPATCYGFLLSMVGETDRHRHIGCRVVPSIIGKPEISVVLRTVWRVKKTPLGSAGNTRPDYQQLLSEIELILWLDSSEEVSGQLTLEKRITTAIEFPEKVTRFGGLSLGESTHLVNDIIPVHHWLSRNPETISARAFLLAERGRLTLPIWVDHVGSSGTRYVTGDLVDCPIAPPEVSLMPRIASPQSI